MGPLSVPPAAVAAKDLQLRMRGWRWAGISTLYAGIMAAITVAFLLHRYSLVTSESTGAGIHLFQTLSLAELFLIVFVTPASIAGAISGERQHRTWDLLVSSPSSMASIVWGKLLAGVVFNLVLLAATLPFFALIFLFGGMTAGDMVPAFLVFLVTVVLLAALSLAVSALTARLTVSYMVSMLLALFLAVGISLVTLYVEASGQLGPLALGSLPFQVSGVSAPLPPAAQLDPLIALLSAVPSDSSGTLLGGFGTIEHAFGLPWAVPFWAAYMVLSLILSLLLVLVTTWILSSPALFRARIALPARSGAEQGR